MPQNVAGSGAMAKRARRELHSPAPGRSNIRDCERLGAARRSSVTRSLRAACWLVPLALLSCRGDTLDWQMPPAPNRGWWKGFALQGTDAEVLALSVHDSLLVAGGYFQHAGPVAASCVAAWDGSAWYALGSGLRRDDCPGTRCDAWAAALTDFQGALIAGGCFTEAGGVPAANIARWDGSSWSALGEGLDGTVLALAVHDEQLYAGGEFTRTGADSIVRYVAAWYGSHWQALGSGVSAPVRALCSTATGLVAGGDFMVAGSDTVHYVARWTGSGWEEMQRVLDGPVYALVDGFPEHPLVYACMRSLPPYSYSRVAALGQGDTYGFSTLSNPDALAFFHGDLIVGGDASYTDPDRNGVSRLNFTTRISMGGGVYGQVFALCVHEGHLYAGGRFETAGHNPSLHIARWDE
jgi:hypothetical protein